MKGDRTSWRRGVRCEQLYLHVNSSLPEPPHTPSPNEILQKILVHKYAECQQISCRNGQRGILDPGLTDEDL